MRKAMVEGRGTRVLDPDQHSQGNLRDISIIQPWPGNAAAQGRALNASHSFPGKELYR